MEKIYQIGAHQFETEEEYLCACKDYDYIKRFMEELNVSQPEVAIELYEKLEKNTSFMRTIVGEAFKDKLVKLYVTDLIQKKKELLTLNDTMTGKEYVVRATRERSMKWFLKGFLVGNGLMLLELLGKGVCLFVEHFFVDTTLVWLPVIQSIITLCCGIWYTCWIIYSIVLLGLSHVGLLRKKSEPRQKLNLLIGCGGIMCVYLCLLRVING